jgi:hypothetical protein
VENYQALEVNTDLIGTLYVFPWNVTPGISYNKGIKIKGKSMKQQTVNPMKTINMVTMKLS